MLFPLSLLLKCYTYKVQVYVCAQRSQVTCDLTPFV
nr:MAG TPA: hypothetical protein [Caudoviricetes sp.]